MKVNGELELGSGLGPKLREPHSRLGAPKTLGARELGAAPLRKSPRGGAYDSP